jgi:hypothetical protein
MKVGGLHTATTITSICKLQAKANMLVAKDQGQAIATLDIGPGMSNKSGPTEGMLLTCFWLHQTRDVVAAEVS